ADQPASLPLPVPASQRPSRRARAAGGGGPPPASTRPCCGRSPGPVPAGRQAPAPGAGETVRAPGKVDSTRAGTAGGPPNGPGSLVDFDPSGAGLDGLRHTHGENTVGQLGLDLLRVGVGGQAGVVGELALAAAEGFALGLLLDLPG